MAATDVLPRSPGAGPAPWAAASTSEQLIDLAVNATASATSTKSPMLSPARAVVQPPSQNSAPSVSAATASAQRDDAKKVGTDFSLPPPPPPGSPPEMLFRYYLTAELRRTGSNADDAIIDRYVRQHYPSFAKDIEGGGQSKSSASQPTTSSMSMSASESAAQASDAALTDATKTAPETTNVPRPASPRPTAVAADIAIRAKVEPGLESSLEEAVGPSEAGIHSAFGAASSSPFKDAVEAIPMASIDPHLMTLDSTSATAMMGLNIGGEGSVADSSLRSEADDMSEDDVQDVKSHRSSVPATEGSSRSSRNSTTPTPSKRDSSIPPGMSAAVFAASDDLRPTPEEYKKLNSKEKRQLRNKISARNFRTRRKEHITALEQQVADRDAIIEGLRQQLHAVTVQNKEMQEEMRQLKTKQLSQIDLANILDALERTISTNTSAQAPAQPTPVTSTSMSVDVPSAPALQRTASSSSLSEFLNLNAVGSSGSRPSTPGSGPPLAAAIAAPSSPQPMSPRPAFNRRASPAITAPNTRKDLATPGGTGGPRAFWGGAAASQSRFMGVHTVLVPHMSVPFSAHPSANDVKSREDVTTSKPMTRKGQHDRDLFEIFEDVLRQGDGTFASPAPPSYAEATAGADKAIATATDEKDVFAKKSTHDAGGESQSQSVEAAA